MGYASVNSLTESQKSVTKSLGINERLALSYRNEWLEVELSGGVNYNHSRNDLQTSNNLDTWQFSYGGMVGITAPWGTALTTNLNMQSRRGYNDASMNTNELIWNAQLSQSFLKGKPLTISLQLYDILHQQSTFSRSIRLRRWSWSRRSSWRTPRRSSRWLRRRWPQILRTLTIPDSNGRGLLIVISTPLLVISSEVERSLHFLTSFNQQIK